MNSEILNSLGLGNIDFAIPLFVMLMFILILFVFVIVITIKYAKLNKKYNKFMDGKNGSSLEEEIVTLFEDVRFVKNAAEKNKKDIHQLYKLQEKNIQKIGMKKYDAFQQMGGQLSFCITLLDENNDGILMNSVHSTDGCYSYVKEIRKGTCTLPLGDEEIETLEMAMGEKIEL